MMRTPGTSRKRPSEQPHNLGLQLQDIYIYIYSESLVSRNKQPLLQVKVFIHLFRLFLERNVRKKGGTNLLGDSTCFTLLHVGPSNLVKKLCLTCVDVPEAKHLQSENHGRSCLNDVMCQSHEEPGWGVREA